MKALRWTIFTLIGGCICGLLANRVGAFLLDNPPTIGGSVDYSVAFSRIIDDPLWVDTRYLWLFWVGFLIIALTGMGTYDYGGRKAEMRELRDKEYGDARWATLAEMRSFAHRSTSRPVEIRIPKDAKMAMRMLRSEPARFIKGKLGIRERVRDPKPGYVESLTDDNIILSEMASLQLSKIPDPALERNKHVFVLGGSGSGKTFNYVGPALLQCSSSYVITDPKGDTLKQYGNFFLERGYELKVVNIKASEIGQSMRYNPLLYITDSTSIIQIADLFIKNTSGGKESSSSSNEDYFVKAERQAYMALIGYLHFFYEGYPQYQTFAELVNLLQLAKGDDPHQQVSPLDKIMFGTYEEDGVLGYEEWLVNKYHGDRAAAERSDEWFVIKQYRGFKSNAGSPETEASVISSCNVRLAPFSVGAIRDFFSDDELDLYGIGERKTAFFLVMSDTDSTFNFILAMLLYQLFDINTNLADKQPGSHCKIPIQCILDELANIGEIPDLDIKIATLRSRWIYLSCILQSTSQLKKMYGDNAAIIEGNCDTTLVLGRLDHESNKQIAERLGKHTVTVVNRSVTHSRQGSWSENETRVAKDLLSADELGSNPEAFAGDDCLVLIKGAHPWRDKKYRTLDHPRYAQLKRCRAFALDDWRWDRIQDMRRADRENERRVREYTAELAATFFGDGEEAYMLEAS